MACRSVKSYVGAIAPDTAPRYTSSGSFAQHGIFLAVRSSNVWSGYGHA